MLEDRQRGGRRSKPQVIYSLSGPKGDRPIVRCLIKAQRITSEPAAPAPKPKRIDFADRASTACFAKWFMRACARTK
jgi:hypothetical protein